MYVCITLEVERRDTRRGGLSSWVARVARALERSILAKISGREGTLSRREGIIAGREGVVAGRERVGLAGWEGVAGFGGAVGRAGPVQRGAGANPSQPSAPETCER